MLYVQQVWSMVSTWAMGWGGLAGLASVILLVLWYFTPPFLSNVTARAFLLNVGLACLAFAFVSGHFINVGYNSCAAEVAKRDRRAIHRAEDGEKEIKSCRDNGGSWDVVSGTCTPK